MLKRGYDSIYSGFRQAPKFPIPHELMFLLRYYKYLGNEQALEMVEKTMAGMANGGLSDQTVKLLSIRCIDRQPVFMGIFFS